MEKVAGVHEQRINTLTLEIHDYAERINVIYNQLRDLTHETNMYFKSELGNEFRKKCNLSLDEFSKINKNILNYAQSLVNAKSKFNRIDDAAIAILRRTDV